MNLSLYEIFLILINFKKTTINRNKINKKEQAILNISYLLINMFGT